MVARPAQSDRGDDEAERDRADLQGAVPPGVTLPAQALRDVDVLERPARQLRHAEAAQQRGGSRVESEVVCSHADTLPVCSRNRIVLIG